MSEEITALRLDIKENSKDIREIKDNHLVHIAADITDVKIRQERHGSDLKWLKKFFWILTTSSVGGLIAGVLNLVLDKI